MWQDLRGVLRSTRPETLCRYLKRFLQRFSEISVTICDSFGCKPDCYWDLSWTRLRLTLTMQNLRYQPHCLSFTLQLTDGENRTRPAASPAETIILSSRWTSFMSRQRAESCWWGAAGDSSDSSSSSSSAHRPAATETPDGGRRLHQNSCV